MTIKDLFKLWNSNKYVLIYGYVGDRMIELYVGVFTELKKDTELMGKEIDGIYDAISERSNEYELEICVNLY